MIYSSPRRLDGKIDLKKLTLIHMDQKFADSIFFGVV